MAHPTNFIEEECRLTFKAFDTQLFLGPFFNWKCLEERNNGISPKRVTNEVRGTFDMCLVFHSVAQYNGSKFGRMLTRRILVRLNLVGDHKLET